MKCEKCGKNEASMHITKIIDGRKSEQYLCEVCANMKPQSAGHTADNFNFNIDDFFGGLFGAGEAVKPSIPNLENVCSRCGMTFSEFAELGKLGCCQCYESFKNRLSKPLRQIHRATEHTGKFPSRLGIGIRKNREIHSLEAQLAACIAKQEFELAAQLRDKIKVLKEE